MHQVDKVLERITRPPPSPVAAKILEVVQNERAGARDLAEVITKDQAFTARILRIVNSAYYGLPQKVTTASRAVALLGFDSIKSLALTLYTFGSFRQEETDTISMVQLWEHSLGCAVGARRLAAHVGHPLPEEAFVAGLLHDMGKALFYQYFKEEFIEAVRMAEEKGVSLCEAESHLLGIDHATAGEVWACKWNLPAVIQYAISFHHHPLLLPETVDSSVRKAVALVHIADLFCEAHQIGKGGDNPSAPIEKGAWSLLALGEEECREILGPIAEEVDMAKELLGLTTQDRKSLGQEELRVQGAKGQGSRAQSQESRAKESGSKPLALSSKLSEPLALSHPAQDGLSPQELLAKFSHFVEAGQQVALLAGLEDLLPNIAAQAKTLVEADAAGVLVPKGDSLEVAGAVGLNGLMGRTIPTEGSLVGWVARMGEPVVIDNIAEASCSWEKEFFGPAGYPSHLLLPVEWAGKRIAVLSIHSRRRRHWAPQEVSLLNPFVGLVAVALENAKLYREAEERAATLQRLNQELEEALSLRKKFLAIVSHELRTPLQVIMGYTQLVTANTFGEPAAKMRKALEKVLKEAGHLLSLIDRLLDLSRIEAGRVTAHREPVNLAGLLDEAVAHTAALLQGKPIVLRCEYDHSLPTLFIDRERLRQVLGHLLDNSAKFTREGEIVLRASAVTGGVEVSVKDTGIGIQAEDQKIIFDGFRQVEDPHTRRHGGVGLGLYIVRRLLELLGGTITVESEVGRGSTFRVWVPGGETA